MSCSWAGAKGCKGNVGMNFGIGDDGMAGDKGSKGQKGELGNTGMQYHIQVM